MSRSVPEWIGKTPDAKVPPRVRDRIFEREGHRCHLSGRVIAAGEPWELDHRQALINGGEHRESNLFPALKDKHRAKTAEDVAEKAKAYARRSKHFGAAKRSTFPCSKASKFKKKLDGSVVLR
jgi:5-methylcytosine-specific restriction endonuclease McrA